MAVEYYVVNAEDGEILRTCETSAQALRDKERLEELERVSESKKNRRTFKVIYSADALAAYKRRWLS